MTFKFQNLFQEYRVKSCSSLEQFQHIPEIVCEVFCSQLKSKRYRGQSAQSGKLQVTELKTAKMEWIKSAQDDLKQQDNFKQLESELGVKEDRVVGKLSYSDLEFDAQRPVILP